MPGWETQELTSLAFCWRLARRDGVTLGFTTHDNDLDLDGLIYRATPGMVPSAIERTSGFDADSVELAGALTSDALREVDLESGRWDGAALKVFAVDWSAPATGAIALVRGELDAVTVQGDKFSAELRGPTTVFDAAVVEETSPECRATLGDHRCRVDMAGRQQFVTITAVSGAVLTCAEPLVAGVFAAGLLRWIDGANAGLETEIRANQAGTMTLVESPHFSVAAGTRAEITQGCDRRFATCTGRFANAVNFRGEPHLPGNDLLTRYAS
jgi:uncharacterized phage protein (TIGR02218 family)